MVFSMKIMIFEPPLTFYKWYKSQKGLLVRNEINQTNQICDMQMLLLINVFNTATETILPKG